MTVPTTRTLSANLSLAALPLDKIQVGDIGIAHTSGVLGWLIRLGTRSKWNHAFVVVYVPMDPTPETIIVVQAQAKGVVYAKLSDVAPGGEYAILPCPDGVDRELVVAMAKTLLREKYAFVSIASIAFNFLPLPIRLDVHQNGTLICSAVVALCLLAGGWLHPWPDLYSVTPANIATVLTNLKGSHD